LFESWICLAIAAGMEAPAEEFSERRRGKYVVAAVGDLRIHIGIIANEKLVPRTKAHERSK
jgi:hypothetical protein